MSSQAPDTTSIPIILCGATERIGQGVIQGLKPDIEGDLTSPITAYWLLLVVEEASTDWNTNISCLI